jgi:heme/copper-type cytochrome/quinol oxidase subunit 2
VNARPGEAIDPRTDQGALWVAIVLGLILIVLVVALPAAYFVWRFRRGEESVPGGSDGTQLFGRTKDDSDPQ